MCDSEVISRLYASVLHENIQNNRISGADIRTGIQNMKEVYKPNPASLSSSIVDVANYNDVAHRAAYLHKYAPFHTALVADMLHRAILENPKLFKDLIFKSGCVNICSLGGGPGSDIIGVLAVLNETFGFFQVSATIIDCMLNWQVTFNSLIQELRYGNYGYLGECVSEQYFDWSYIGHNLLGKMSDQVNRAISTANLVTMIKFVSASACKDTPAMIKRIFRLMKRGALVLYIDNAGGGFHQLVKKEAEKFNLKDVFYREHENFKDYGFNVERFGYVACFETTVTIHIWQKISSGVKGYDWNNIYFDEEFFNCGNALHQPMGNYTKNIRIKHQSMYRNARISRAQSAASNVAVTDRERADVDIVYVVLMCVLCFFIYYLISH